MKLFFLIFAKVNITVQFTPPKGYFTLNIYN